MQIEDEEEKEDEFKQFATSQLNQTAKLSPHEQ